ncbi:hypothetical protein ACVDFE_27650 [Lentzea chajnantorensis]
MKFMQVLVGRAQLIKGSITAGVVLAGLLGLFPGAAQAAPSDPSGTHAASEASLATNSMQFGRCLTTNSMQFG